MYGVSHLNKSDKQNNGLQFSTKSFKELHIPVEC